MPFCIYLRKSRKDLEAEQQGAGETLARHKRTLLELAAQRNHPIEKIYQEIVSGDSIAERPLMQQLLADVQAGRWDGVYTMEVERLARGDTIDQGIVAQTFQYSDTLIITPMRTYNPANEADAEYFEFGLFMSRREYNTTKRRLQAGRVASIREGKYLGSRNPFGYERCKLQGQKGWSLRIVPEQAEMVRWAADMYLHGRDVVDPETGEAKHENVGAQTIAHELNTMGVKTTMGGPWTADRVRKMLCWPGYIGKVQWYQRETKISINNGVRTKTRQPSNKYMLIDAKHEPILDEAMWNALQDVFHSRKKGSVNAGREVKNPLNGLLKCAICGKAMVRTPMYGPLAGIDYIKCSTVRCPTSACPLEDVERMVLNALQQLVWQSENNSWPATPEHDQNTRIVREAAEKHLADLEKRRLRLMDLLEQGVYDVSTYTERNALLTAEIATAKEALAALPEYVPDQKTIVDAILPEIKHVLQAYSTATSPASKNTLLLTILERVVYNKTHRCSRNENPSDFLTLELFPRMK